METPIDLLLDNLATKLKSQDFSAMEVQELDMATQNIMIGYNSQNINKLNYVWSLLDHHHNYWNALGLLIQHSINQNTKVYAYQSLIRHISRSWNELAEDIKESLRVHIAITIHELVCHDASNGLLLTLDNVLVVILKYQSDTLLKQFMSNLEAQGLSVPPSKVKNNLKIIERLTQSATNNQMPTQIFLRFQRNMDQLLQKTLFIVCQCLNSHFQLVPSCLQFLKTSIKQIPPFYLLNCNLIQKMIDLVKHVDFQQDLQPCFEALFQLKNVGAINQSYQLKIAQKCLNILDILLIIQNRSQGQFKFQVQSQSTEDTRPHFEPASFISCLLINCFRYFLVRYSPSIKAESQDENKLQVQFDEQTPFVLSKDLKNQLKRIFWPLVKNLLNFVDKQIPENFFEIDEEMCLNLLQTIRMLLNVLQKLNISYDSSLSILIDQIIMKLTPIPRQFAKYYLSEQLIKINDIKSFGQKIEFGYKEIEESFKQVMKKIMTQQHLGYIFFKQIQQKVIIFENNNKMRPQYSIRSNHSDQFNIMNVLNRLSWSIVAAYQASPLDLEQLNLNKIFGQLSIAMKFQNREYLKKCFSINLKYLLLAYHPEYKLDSYLSLIVVNGIKNSNSQQIVQFSLLILSKIINNIFYKHRGQFDIADLQIFIQKLHHLQNFQTNQAALIQAYPAFVKVLIEMQSKKDFNRQAKFAIKQAQRILQRLLNNHTKEIQNYIKKGYTHQSQQYNHNLSMFQKLEKISQILISDESVCELKKIILKKVFSLIKKSIQDNEYIFNIFNLQIDQIRQDHKSFQRYACFIDHYISISACFTRLVIYVVTQGIVKSSLYENQFINITVKNIMLNFSNQKRHQSHEALNLLIQYFKWLYKTDQAQKKETLNLTIQQVYAICQPKSNQLELRLINSKISFEKELVREYLSQLNENNTQMLVLQLQKIDKQVYLPRQREAYLQMLCEIVNKIIQNTEKGTSMCIQKMCLTLFQINFRLFFALWCKNKEYSQVITDLFYRQIQFADASGHWLSKNPMKANNQLYYMSIYKLMQDKLNLQGNEQQTHHYLLNDIFKQKNQQNFKYCVQEYTNFLLKMMERKQAK